MLAEVITVCSTISLLGLISGATVVLYKKIHSNTLVLLKLEEIEARRESDERAEKWDRLRRDL